MHDPNNQDDVNFRRLGNYEKVLWELARLSLAPVFFHQLCTEFGLQLINPILLGLGEADLVVLAKLTDGRYLLIVWEHKSYRDEYAKLQLARYVFAKAYELVQDKEHTEGKVPIMYGVVALHREASKYPPADLDDLAGLTNEEEKKAAMNTITVDGLDFGQIGRKNLCEDPEAGGLILPFTVGWGGRELDDGDLVYLGRAVRLHKEEMKRYIVGQVVDRLGVPFERWRTVATGEMEPEEAKKTVDAIVEQLRSEGEARGLAKAFLMQARSKFRRVPRNRQAQVRAASIPQLEDWMRRIFTATSLNAVFDGDADGGHAINGVPAKPPSRKGTAN